jgi:hypothetical protein
MFTKKKEFKGKIRFKEDVKFGICNRNIINEMKMLSGIEYIFPLRYAETLFAIMEEIIKKNTGDREKKILKMNITEEEMRENNFDEAPKGLFTRKISNTMLDYSRKTRSNKRSFSALAVIGYNYDISEYNKPIEISQCQHPKNERKAWIYVLEHFWR